MHSAQPIDPTLPFVNSDPPLPSPAAAAYPGWLENWWKERACQLLAVRDFTETQPVLEKEIRRLSDLFTTGRETRFGDYGKDERLLLAYGLFYFPQTFVRIRFPLREALLLRGWRPSSPDGSVRLLDLGAGLGGATVGAALLLQEMPFISGVEALAVDQSGGSLAALDRIGRENRPHLPQVRIGTARGDLKTWFRKAGPQDRWDLIIASFSLGEAFFEADDDAVHQWLKNALRHLRPGGLLLITEPALRETSERIERLRNLIAAEGTGHIWAPCPHHRRCPLLETGKYWCHEVRSWPVPESLAFLNRRLFRSVRDLKFSFLLAGPPPAEGSAPETASAHTMRLVSPLSELKGRYLWTGCAGDGDRYEYEIQKRDLSRSEQKELQALERGDIVEVVSSEPLGSPGKRRVSAFQQIRSWSQGAAQGGSDEE
jgi:SAM-dependent methyltransferase